MDTPYRPSGESRPRTGSRRDLSIRPLTPADEPFLWEALYHAVYVPPGGSPPEREIVRRPELARYVERWGHGPGDVGVLALVERRPVGAAWLRCWSGPERGYGFVDSATPELSIAVLPDYRGQGIGTRLLDALLAVADERFAAVSLSVSESNPARRLYERLGFRVLCAGTGTLTMVRRAT